MQCWQNAKAEPKNYEEGRIHTGEAVFRSFSGRIERYVLIAGCNFEMSKLLLTYDTHDPSTALEHDTTIN